ACPSCGRCVSRAGRASTVAVVCDDSPSQRRMVAATLRGRFDRVVEAEGGRDALDVVARERPDLLVVDHRMPDVSGVDVIRRLRSRLDTSTLPIVMLTADDEEELETTALEAGADDYLRKPVSAERLQAR